MISAIASTESQKQEAACPGVAVRLCCSTFVESKASFDLGVRSEDKFNSSTTRLASFLPGLVLAGSTLWRAI